MISCIILSAGQSLRFGSPKALALINGVYAIKLLLTRLLNSQVSEIILVLGYQRELIEPHILKHNKVKVVYNKHHKFGQTSSVQSGLNALSSDSKGVLIFPVDYPFVKSGTIDELIHFFKRNSEKICLPVCLDHKGHPPLFPCAFYTKILQLDSSVGLNTVLHQNQDKTEFIEVDDPGILQSFNTQEELAQILASI